MLAAPTAHPHRRSSPNLKVPGLELRRVFGKVRDDVLCIFDSLQGGGSSISWRVVVPDDITRSPCGRRFVVKFSELLDRALSAVHPQTERTVGTTYLDVFDTFQSFVIRFTNRFCQNNGRRMRNVEHATYNNVSSLG